MLPFENAKLLPKSKVFEEQVASRTKEAGRHDRQKPQKAQHKNQFYTGACQSKYTAHLLDPTADRYSGEPQPRDRNPPVPGPIDQHMFDDRSNLCLHVRISSVLHLD
jgi:hypothetical protein